MIGMAGSSPAMTEKVESHMPTSISPRDLKAALHDGGEIALLDEAFVAKHLTPEQCKPRKVLYEDKELGFCICGHVYEGAARGAPHDHGSSWAIDGVAKGDTEMTDWRIVRKAADGSPNLVAPIRTYMMKPGDCMVYDVGALHSPNRAGPTKLVRIEGKNLDHVQRSNIKAA